MAWTKEKARKYWHEIKHKYKEKRSEVFREKYRNDVKFRNIIKRKAKEYYHKKRETIIRRRLKLRFQIFKRDDFTCQYCGRKAPDVVLHIDHIHPKSKGGLNSPNNYRTACSDCNLGKGDCLL